VKVEAAVIWWMAALVAWAGLMLLLTWLWRQERRRGGGKALPPLHLRRKERWMKKGRLWRRGKLGPGHEVIECSAEESWKAGDTGRRLKEKRLGPYSVQLEFMGVELDGCWFRVVTTRWSPMVGRTVYSSVVYTATYQAAVEVWKEEVQKRRRACWEMWKAKWIWPWWRSLCRVVKTLVEG